MYQHYDAYEVDDDLNCMSCSVVAHSTFSTFATSIFHLFLMPCTNRSSGLLIFSVRVPYWRALRLFSFSSYPWELVWPFNVGSLSICLLSCGSCFAGTYPSPVRLGLFLYLELATFYLLSTSDFGWMQSLVWVLKAFCNAVMYSFVHT